MRIQIEKQRDWVFTEQGLWSFGSLLKEYSGIFPENEGVPFPWICVEQLCLERSLKMGIIDAGSFYSPALFGWIMGFWEFPVPLPDNKTIYGDNTLGYSIFGNFPAGSGAGLVVVLPDPAGNFPIWSFVAVPRFWNCSSLQKSRSRLLLIPKIPHLDLL